MKECARCGGSQNIEKHHIISGNGRRLKCETPQSVKYLCHDCHKFVHSGKGNGYRIYLRRNLQAEYYGMGYSEEQARELMGGKLELDDNGDIYK